MKLAAGTYYIGDPCYAFPANDNDDWSQFCADYLEAEDAKRFVFGFRNFECFTHGTAHGDGRYELKDGNGVRIAELGVDAGIIGCLPKALVDQLDDGGSNHKRLMAEHTFPQAFYVDYEDGKFEIGDLSVQTDFGHEEDLDRTQTP